MAYRYTDTDKWNDAWFSELKPIEKLLFYYICDNCDIAGFIEILPKKWAAEIGEDKTKIEGALKGLARGFIYSNTNDCLFVRNYLKHQKNVPLNPERNMAHRGIIKRFELYSYKFDIKDIDSFLEGASKGLGSPYGIGIGNGIGNGIPERGVGKTKAIDISEREKDFYNAVAFYVNDYPKEILRAFFEYWSELNTSGKKMKFELEKTWELSKRLNTWANRDKTFNSNKNGSKRKTSGATDQELAGIFAKHFATDYSGE